MSRTTIRNRRGDLTAWALRRGYTEQRSWLTVGMEHHHVSLSCNPQMSPGFCVAVEVFGPGATHRKYSYEYFESVDDAREAFKKASKR